MRKHAEERGPAGDPDRRGRSPTSTHDMGEAAALEKDGVERDLQELLADPPHWCGEGFRLVRREWPTDIGPVDLMCRDDDDAWIAVEIKRIGTIDAVEQLTRYLERIRLDPAMASMPRRAGRAGGQAPGARARRGARVAWVEVDLAVSARRARARPRRSSPEPCEASGSRGRTPVSIAGVAQRRRVGDAAACWSASSSASRRPAWAARRRVGRVVPARRGLQPERVVPLFMLSRTSAEISLGWPHSRSGRRSGRGPGAGTTKPCPLVGLATRAWARPWATPPPAAAAEAGDPSARQAAVASAAASPRADPDRHAERLQHALEPHDGVAVHVRTRARATPRPRGRRARS